MSFEDLIILNEKIDNLEKQLQMKQDDWIEACKESDKLEKQLDEAFYLLNEEEKECSFHETPKRRERRKAFLREISLRVKESKR